MMCIKGHTFNLLYRDWIAEKLTNREPSQEEKEILNHLLAMQPHCNADLCTQILADFWQEKKTIFSTSIEFFTPGPRSLNSRIVDWNSTNPPGHSPKKRNTALIKLKELFLCSFLINVYLFLFFSLYQYSISPIADKEVFLSLLFSVWNFPRMN